MNAKQFLIAVGILYALFAAWIWGLQTQPKFWGLLPWPIEYTEPTIIERSQP